MNRPLQILHVTKSTAGVAEYVRWLANGLDQSLFLQTVVCLSENGPEFAAELSQIPGIQAFSLEMKRYKIDPISDGRLVMQLAQFIRSKSFDLIHAHASKPGFLARLAALGSGVPVIYSPHCYSFHAETPAWQAYPLAAVERFATKYLTARIMTLTDGEQELALRYRVGRPEQFVTVNSGIDVNHFEPVIDPESLRASLGIPADAPLVGAVGRLSKQKSPLDFIHMAAYVHLQNPLVHFIWVGTGPLEDEARQLGEALGFSHVLHFVGQRSDVQTILQLLDCFVLPSLWEGFSIVLLEAMACGVPIVATNIPGNAEAIQSGVDGLLVPPKDPCALAFAVLDVLNDPSLAESFRKNSRQKVELQFTREIMLNKITRLYQNTVKGIQMEQINSVGQQVNR